MSLVYGRADVGETQSLLVRRFFGGADAVAYRLVVKLRKTGWKHRRHLGEDSGFGHDGVEFDVVALRIDFFDSLQFVSQSHEKWATVGGGDVIEEGEGSVVIAATNSQSIPLPIKGNQGSDHKIQFLSLIHI